MDLKEWDQKVRPALMEIREHASWIAPHALKLGLAAGSLQAAPDFETKAEDELAKAEQVLTNALSVVRTAQSRFAGLRKLEAAE